MNLNITTIARFLFIGFLGFALYSCGDEVDCETAGFNIGDLCNDRNEFTFDDVVLPNCTCAGTKFEIGYPCNDGDDLTEDDMLTADCICEGTPTYVKTVKAILDSNCATNSACHSAGSSATFPMSTYDESVAAITTVGLVRIKGAVNNDSIFLETHQNFERLDQDSIDYIIDWIDGNTPECGLNLFVGDSCDDEDEDNFNDVISDACICAGFDCELLNLNIGDPCDDGDDETFNDVLDSECDCVGVDCEVLNLNVGDLCDDENDDSFNDVVTDDCECQGVDCEILNLNVGDPCDDLNDDNFNDVVIDDCFCRGVDCEVLNLNVEDPCDDGDDTTINDTVNTDCVCVGE